MSTKSFIPMHCGIRALNGAQYGGAFQKSLVCQGTLVLELYLIKIDIESHDCVPLDTHYLHPTQLSVEYDVEYAQSKPISALVVDHSPNKTAKPLLPLRESLEHPFLSSVASSRTNMAQSRSNQDYYYTIIVARLQIYYTLEPN